MARLEDKIAASAWICKSSFGLTNFDCSIHVQLIHENKLSDSRQHKLKLRAANHASHSYVLPFQKPTQVHSTKPLTSKLWMDNPCCPKITLLFHKLCFSQFQYINFNFSSSSCRQLSRHSQYHSRFVQIVPHPSQPSQWSSNWRSQCQASRLVYRRRGAGGCRQSWPGWIWQRPGRPGQQ